MVIFFDVVSRLSVSNTSVRVSTDVHCWSIIIIMYFESQTKLHYLYDSLLCFPFFVEPVLEHVYICCVDHYCREIVPSSVGSEINRVELFSSHPVCWSIFHELNEQVFLNKLDLVRKIEFRKRALDFKGNLNSAHEFAFTFSCFPTSIVAVADSSYDLLNNRGSNSPLCGLRSSSRPKLDLSNARCQGCHFAYYIYCAIRTRFPPGV